MCKAPVTYVKFVNNFMVLQPGLYAKPGAAKTGAPCNPIPSLNLPLCPAAARPNDR